MASAEQVRANLTFTPTLNDHDEQEVHIVRSWWFTGSNKLRAGDQFEELRIQVGDRVLWVNDPISAQDRIEKHLFPAHVTPAFFFDGEQAQALIEDNRGEAAIRKSVEVMFGSKVVEELSEAMSNYLSRTHAAAGGKRKTSEKQAELNAKVARRTALNERIGKLEGDLDGLNHEKEEKSRERNRLTEELSRLGGGNADVRKVQETYVKAQTDKRDAEKTLIELTRRLGLPLAVSRMALPIRNRLHAEEILENWEGLKRGTREKESQVMSIALPEPAESDPLLGNLSQETRSKVRQRFSLALEAIYNPRNTDAANEYLLGHVKGDLRAKTLSQLTQAQSLGGGRIKALAKRLNEARETFEVAKAHNDRLTNLPVETSEIRKQLDRLNGQIDEAIRRIGAIEMEIRKFKSDVHDLSSLISREEEELAKLEPEQRRIALAERVNLALETLIKNLKPTTTARLEEHVTKHFLSIADKRYRGGRITFHDGEPKLQYGNGDPSSLLATMSGFEKRSFGIAFSLALAEITQRRIPLVIDTPLGNADSAYRPRTLEALARFDADQVIILTHDREVTADLLPEIEGRVGQKFLVEFREWDKNSVVQPNKFFTT